ncbi:MAG: exodeoxyribonuclease VII large subunit [Gallionella sp.]|nr:exodeoxyribonuclease VII large subunit [Gallionella sp.]
MSSELFFTEKNRVFGVAELTRSIKQLIESSVPLVWVRGEISNLTKAASGHWYFSLKDDQAQLRCVMFRHKNQIIKESISNGVQVEILASATLYEARGDFQLTVEQMRLAGLGALYERFAQLKAKLENEGLFDASRKRALPTYPKRVGIVTSPQAAALRDVLSTLHKRLPTVPVVLYPTPVQGVGSAEKIALAINIANQRAECDVLIVCRGGGSIEDLWSFNEETVARAIATSAIPVVSGVGHETDFTIADFVADERAPTPTAAAQRVVPDRHALRQSLRDIAQHLQRAQRNRMQAAMQTTDYLQRRLVHPAQQLQRQRVQLQTHAQRLQRAYRHTQERKQWQWHSLASRLQAAHIDPMQTRAQLERCAERLIAAMRTAQTRQSGRLDNLGQQLALLDPKQVLTRGYSVVRDAQGRVLSDARRLHPSDKLQVTFAQGWAKVQVSETGES